MTIKELKEQVFEANMLLPKYHESPLPGATCPQWTGEPDSPSSPAAWPTRS